MDMAYSIEEFNVTFYNSDTTWTCTNQFYNLQLRYNMDMDYSIEELNLTIYNWDATWTCSNQFYNLQFKIEVQHGRSLLNSRTQFYKLKFSIEVQNERALLNWKNPFYNLKLRYNMDVLYSIEDLIAAFGGLFGLCTGASLLRSYIWPK